MARTHFLYLALSLFATPAAAQLPAPAEILSAMEATADWQLANRGSLTKMPAAKPRALDPRDWQQAAFWVGLTDLADRSSKPRYREAILAVGKEQNWRLGVRPYHADDQLIGQVWIWAARNGAGAAAIEPTKAYYDRVFASPPTGSLEFFPNPAGSGDPLCTVRWCWCDALFMAPPTLAAMTKQTGDPRYVRFSAAEYKAAQDYLYDRREQLFYRDSRFFDRRDAADRKVFWSRGNGWVLAGLARTIPLLDRVDPERARLVKLFKAMSARVVKLQKPDGYWPASLLDNSPDTLPETSGTGFYVASLAWGIKAGLLDRRTYQPAVERGWDALRRAVQADGMLGWVQQVGDRPDSVAAGETQFYGTGAFLLAGAAVHDLASARR